MTDAQKRLRALRERQSQERQRMAELGMAEALDDETRAELDRIETGTPDLERQLRAAQVAVDADGKGETRATGRPGRPRGPGADRWCERRGRSSPQPWSIGRRTGRPRSFSSTSSWRRIRFPWQCSKRAP